MLVNGCIGRKLRVKCGSQYATLLDEHGMSGILGQNLDSLTDRLDDRRTDEDHLEWLLPELGRGRVNIARELTAIAIAQHRNVDQTKGGLRRAVNIAGEKNRTGTRAEKCNAVGSKFLESIE